MSAHILLNLLNEFGKREESILSLFVTSLTDTGI